MPKFVLGRATKRPRQETSMATSVASAALAVLTLAVAPVGLSGPAGAASPERMMAQCRNRAHDTLRIRLPDIDTKYEGQRVDGTHAVNGTATLKGTTTTFQCSFGKAGRRIIQFVVNKPQGGNGGSNGGGDAAGNGKFNATGNINCAEFSGQPFKACKFGVVRRGSGNASVTVFLSQGVERIIDFKGGKAVSSNAPGGVISEMKSDLITVHIGTSERYEMPDAVINGG